jgi:hypothetical protein
LTAENQAGLSDGGFQRIPDQVTERVSFRPIRRGDFIRVDKDQHGQFLAARKTELWLVEVLALHTGGNTDGWHAVLLEDVIEFSDRFAGILQRTMAIPTMRAGKRAASSAMASFALRSNFDLGT